MPVWGNKQIVNHIEKYRDTFKYIHDQSLHLANEGYTMNEIGNMIVLPDSLNRNWSSRGYYGSVSHNARAVYNFYLGYFDGNPADLNPYTPVEAAKRYVKQMGGVDNIMKAAKESFDQGDYRWTAEMLKYVIYYDPKNQAARNLQADAFEQLGYQAENATWRGFYLSGAQELRKGIIKPTLANPSSEDVVNNMPVDMLFDYLAIRLDSQRAANKIIKMNFDFSDTKEQLGVTIENSVLNYRHHLIEKPDVSLTLTKNDLNKILIYPNQLNKMISDGKIQVKGDPAKVKEFLSLMDTFNFWFNIVTPN